MPNPFLEKPLLKVSRPVAACSRCRTAKIKCDGKLPSCSACERVGKASSCSGASDEFAKGKERSYVASLEGYCEKLEKEIGRLSQRTLGSAARGGTVDASITGTATAGQHPREVSDIDDLVGDFGFLSVNATSRDFRGISSTSFANLLLSVAAVDPISSGTPSEKPSQCGGLPLRHEATTILQFYFDNVFPQLPFFSETRFWSSVETVYEGGGRFATAMDQFLVRLVLAIAAASISQHHDDQHQQRSLAWVRGALAYAEDVLLPGSVGGLQAMMLLAQYSLVNPLRFRSWYLVGMAARVMVDLGLHQEEPAQEGSVDPDRDDRRRVFHCLYCLDRGVSSALGRTFSFSDASVAVPLPRDEECSSTATTPLSLDWTQQSHAHPGLYLVRIRRLLSQVYQENSFSGREPATNPQPDIWARCAEAQAWLDQAPLSPSPPPPSALPSAADPGTLPRHFPLLYRLEFLYTTVVILSPSHRVPRLPDYHQVVLLDRCLQYIEQLHQALDLVPFLTLIDIQRGYQVSRRFVDLVRQGVLSLAPEPAPGSAPGSVPGSAPDMSPQGPSPARARRCLQAAQALFRYSGRRWGVYSFLEQFELAAASVLV